jgi:hypothetical protein
MSGMRVQALKSGMVSNALLLLFNEVERELVRSRARDRGDG